MKKFLLYALLALSSAFLPLASASAAGERGTADEASALVKKGIAYLKANGPEKAYAAFNDPKGEFVDRDLYLFVFDMSGKTLAHGANKKLLDKNLIALKDADGKPFIQEFIDVANKKGHGWVDYKWPHPQTKAIENKSSYVEKLPDGTLIGVGIYK
ncbi:MAG: cache domain-containing protein [Massilia sp.]